MPLNPEHDSFGPTEIAVLVGAFHDALQVLGLTNRQNDPAITLVAKIVIDLAEHGETNPHRLQDEAVKQSRKRLAWFGFPAQLADRVYVSGGDVQPTFLQYEAPWSVSGSGSARR
jgi:hypothetical protein